MVSMAVDQEREGNGDVQLSLVSWSRGRTGSPPFCSKDWPLTSIAFAALSFANCKSLYIIELRQIFMVLRFSGSLGLLFLWDLIA